MEIRYCEGCARQTSAYNADAVMMQEQHLHEYLFCVAYAIASSIDTEYIIFTGQVNMATYVNHRAPRWAQGIPLKTLFLETLHM